MPDSAGTRVSTWPLRDFEARMLVELLRLSRLTVLYGAEGAGRTTFLKTNVLPLLRTRSSDDRRPQAGKPRVVVPFPDRRVGDRTPARGIEVPVIFDRWDGEPLPALLARILHALRSESMRAAVPLPFLTDSLAAWNEALGVHVFIFLDGFEHYLRAPFDRAGIAEFDEEFVRAINAPRLGAHFLLSVRDDAEALLNRRFRGRIVGFGDTFLRLPGLHKSTPPSLPAPGQTHRFAAMAVPPVSAGQALLTPSTTQRGDASFATVSARAVPPPPMADPRPLAVQTPLQKQAPRSIALVPEARQPAPGEALSVTPPQSERPVLSSVRIPLAAIVAGLAIGAGAGYFSIYGYHALNARQSASAPTDLVPATMHDADAMPDPAVPPTLADPSAPPPSSERATAVHESVPPPRSQAPTQHGRSAQAASKARQAAVEAAPVARVAASDWKTEMRRELDVCRQESFFPRVVCLETVRWKHCAPDRWNTIPECAATAGPAAAAKIPAAGE